MSGRGRKEASYRTLSLIALEKERSRRGRDLTYSWTRRFGQDASGFLREMIGPEWEGPDWIAWRAFVAAVFGKPMTKDEQAIYFQCTGRAHLPERPCREAWCPVGRRGGKSRTFALLAVWLAVCRDWTPYLVPGEAGVIPIVADARDRAQQTMGYVKAALMHPKLAPLVERELTEEVYLKGRVIIRVSTASVRGARSRTVLSALCDEIAFWSSDELGANPDREIIRSLRPAMLTIPDARLFCMSSPYTRHGMLWEQYHAYYGKDDDRVLVWQAATQVMHPSVDLAEIERAYREDPVAAAAEYGAQFRTDIEEILPYEVVESCVIKERFELPPDRHFGYKVFVDPSGGSSDSMTLAVAHQEAGGKTVLDLVRECKPPFSPEDVVTQFSEIALRYGAVRVVGDRYAGEWPRERFSLHGITYEVSEKSRSELYQALIPLVNSTSVELLDNRVLVRQLVSLERRTRASARDLIDHPPGGHDDVANAAAGAVSLAAYAPGGIWQRPWAVTKPGGIAVGGSATIYAQQARNHRGRFLR